DFFHVVILEPISYMCTRATETRRDAGRGGEPEAICRNCEGSRQRDAPGSPRPLRGCGQDGRLLRCPPWPYRHMPFVGRLASGPSWPQRITRLVMKQVLECGMARYPGLTLRVLTAEAPALGPGKARLIAAIEATGSISAAARQMGMSYRRAWQLVEAINSSFNRPVVITAVGGKRGGGAAVTAFGRELVEIYARMEEKASAAITRDLKQFSRLLRKPAAAR